MPSLELLIQWQGCPSEEASWEDYDLLAGQFPSFRLEDKSFFQDGSIDKSPPPLLLTYSRKRTCGKDKDQPLDLIQISQLIGTEEAAKDDVEPLSP